MSSKQTMIYLQLMAFSKFDSSAIKKININNSKCHAWRKLGAGLRSAEPRRAAGSGRGREGPPRAVQLQAGVRRSRGAGRRREADGLVGSGRWRQELPAAAWCSSTGRRRGEPGWYLAYASTIQQQPMNGPWTVSVWIAVCLDNQTLYIVIGSRCWAAIEADESCQMTDYRVVCW